jgi:hypothetical protein
MVILILFSCSRANVVKFQKPEKIWFGSDTLNFPHLHEQLSIYRGDTVRLVKVRKTYKL